MDTLKIFERYPPDYFTLANHDIKSFCWSWLRELNMCIPDLIYKPTVEPGNRIMILENWDGMMKRGFRIFINGH